MTRKKLARKKQGWRNKRPDDSARHSQSARGIPNKRRQRKYVPYVSYADQRKAEAEGVMAHIRRQSELQEREKYAYPSTRYGDFRDITAQQIKQDIRMSRLIWDDLTDYQAKLERKGISSTKLETKLASRLYKLRKKFDWWGEFVE